MCRVDTRERDKRTPAPWIGDGPCGRGTTPVHHRLATAALRLGLMLLNPCSSRCRDGGPCNGGHSGDSYYAINVVVARMKPRWNAEPPAHAGAVGIAARRSSSNGLSAPPSHQSRLAGPTGDRLLVLVIAVGPCAGEEEQKTTTKCGGGCSHRSSCGTFSRRNWHQAQRAGCRASKGRFPPPLWMSAGLHSVVEGHDTSRWWTCQAKIASAPRHAKQSHNVFRVQTTSCEPCNRPAGHGAAGSYFLAGLNRDHSLG